MNARAEQMEGRLEWPLLIAALLTVPAIGIELSNVDQPWDTIGAVLNWTTWAAFLAELVVTTREADDRGQWLRDHPLDVAIVVLTPPFLPSSLQAARVFRVLRLLRLVRAASLARRLLTTEGVRDAAVLALLSVLGGGAAFAAIENGHHDKPVSAWDGVWWAMTTVTTVGYGDLAPATTGGRIVAIGVMLVGIGFVAILTAAAAERFMRTRQQDRAQREELSAQLEEVLRRLDAIQGGRDSVVRSSPVREPP